MARNAQAILQELQDLPGVPGHITPRTFRSKGTTQVNTIDKRSEVASWTLPTVRRIKGGQSNPFDLAIPAYETKTTDGTADNSETFNLAHNLIDSPVTEDIEVYEGSQKLVAGTDYTVDYANDSIDYTDDGTNNTLHIWYITDAPATLEVVKASPSAQASATQELFSAPLNLVHQTRQAEQPEYFEFRRDLEGFVASDMKLKVFVKAPYEVRFEDSAGDGVTPDNLLMNIPVEKGQGTVEGLRGLVTAAMR